MWPLKHRTGNPEITQKKQLRNSIFRFGVLQLRLHWFETIHLEVVASEVGYLNILQDCVCALFTLQAKTVRIVVVYFGLL